LKYAAFLRGINLGKVRRISNADLKRHFEDMGLEEVGTFRASGNVIFTAGRESEKKLIARVEKALREALGYDVTVFLRDEKELKAIAALQPFPPKKVERSKGKLQVSILPKTPPAKARDAVLAMATEDDPLAFGERELYWLPSGGQMESELDLNAIEKLVGPTTRRTMGTIEQIAAKHFAAD
jgi:uncharacterized protein (DUF1697 family)